LAGRADLRRNTGHGRQALPRATGRESEKRCRPLWAGPGANQSGSVERSPRNTQTVTGQGAGQHHVQPGGGESGHCQQPFA
nr:hypothetical protein [Tanacetum cinerariifolium]